MLAEPGFQADLEEALLSIAQPVADSTHTGTLFTFSAAQRRHTAKRHRIPQPLSGNDGPAPVPAQRPDQAASANPLAPVPGAKAAVQSLMPSAVPGAEVAVPSVPSAVPEAKAAVQLLPSAAPLSASRSSASALVPASKAASLPATLPAQHTGIPPSSLPPDEAHRAAQVQVRHCVDSAPGKCRTLVWACMHMQLDYPHTWDAHNDRNTNSYLGLMLLLFGGHPWYIQGCTRRTDLTCRTLDHPTMDAPGVSSRRRLLVEALCSCMRYGTSPTTSDTPCARNVPSHSAASALQIF